MGEFLQMDGYGPYIWSAYGLVIAVMTVLGIASWRRQRALAYEAQRLSASQRRRRREAREGNTEELA